MRIIFVILLLAAYGAYALFSSLFGRNQEGASKEKPPAVSVAAGVIKEPASLLSLDGAKDLALSATAMATGVEVKKLPESGCSDSLLSADKVLELVNSMPEPQRTALAKALDMSSSVWTAQLYKDSTGAGLCLPQHGRLVRLPVGVNLDFLN